MSKKAARRSNAGRARQHEQRQRQQRGFLVVSAFEERRHDPDHDGGHTEQIRCVQPAGEALREHQQRGANDAAEKVGCFDDAERQHATQQRQPPGRGRGGTGKQQDPAAQEGESRQEARGEALGHATERVANPRGLRAPLMQFVGHEHDERDRQWQQVVHDSVHHQRREQRAGREEWPEEHDHETFENAYTTGYLTGEPKQLRGEEGAQEAQKGQLARRQQRVEHRTGDRPVENRHPQLCTGEARGGEWQLETSHSDRRAAYEGRRDVAEAQRDQDPAERRGEPPPGNIERGR